MQCLIGKVMKPAFGVTVCPFSTPHVTGSRQLRLSAAGDALPTEDAEDEGFADGGGVGLIRATGAVELVQAASISTTTSTTALMSI